METVTHHDRVTAYRHVDRRDEPDRSDAAGCCFVHGSGATGRVWNGQLPLARDRPITTLDLSGHGDSEDIEARAGYQTLTAYADDVLAVLESTGDRVLIGNSLGGAVAQHLLIERDVDVDAAVLTGTGARLGVLEDLLDWLDNDFERANEFLHEPGRLFLDPDPDVRERSSETMAETGSTVTYRDFLTSHRFDVRDRLGEISVPTLVVYGSGDQLTPPWFHEYLADEIPETTLVEIDDAAHLAMVEQPAAFNEALTSFLTDEIDG
ncbi:alpha/beta hydrolase fold protein [Halovivax asiaticus JCM 14624]|uniref:Alpha/beta hydrolase fold protein n=1 Tax=Halovivax asiaticus JCM 14624 TaxID=1227490 RepID=M0B8C6_9EURY|nr:alpha/beta fold hydrolase [Halovivax asiaticus]ELZ07045.1 alpha/beta hydrolase fold protein [Halovivax asiaticus JCM 14624]